MITNLRRRTAMAAAGLGAARAGHPAGSDGGRPSRQRFDVGSHDVGNCRVAYPSDYPLRAIAYAPSGASGKAWHQRTPARAEQVALEKCGDKTCKVVSRFTRCGAVAYNGSKYQGGTGLTRRAAEDDAVNRLEGGRIVNWACN